MWLGVIGLSLGIVSPVRGDVADVMPKDVLYVLINHCLSMEGVIIENINKIEYSTKIGTVLMFLPIFQLFNFTQIKKFIILKKSNYVLSKFYLRVR